MQNAIPAEESSIQNDTNSSANQKSAQTESRIRVRNWLMLADQSILQKSILNNSTNPNTEQETSESEPAAPEPKRKRLTRLSTITNKTNNNNKSISNDTVSPAKKVSTATSTGNGVIGAGENNVSAPLASPDNASVRNNLNTTATTTGDGNSTYDGADDNTTEVIVKFERSSSSCDDSETEDPFNYDLKLSSPMSWAFDSVKIEESEFEEAPDENEDDEETVDADINDCRGELAEQDAEQENENEPDTGYNELTENKESSNRNSTRRVYSTASNKLRSSIKKRLVDSAGLNLPPETTITTTTPNETAGNATTTSGNTEICLSSDKKYRILIQNQRMRKESLEHSEDMIYNANIEKPWVCKNCNRNYKWKNSLKCHLKNECGQPPRFFCSKLCGYATNVHSNLKRHLNTKCRDKIGDESEKSENTHYTLVLKKQDSV